MLLSKISNNDAAAAYVDGLTTHIHTQQTPWEKIMDEEEIFVLWVLRKYLSSCVIVNKVIPFLRTVRLSPIMMKNILNPCVDVCTYTYLKKLKILKQNYYFKNETAQLRDQLMLLASHQKSKDINVIVTFVKTRRLVFIDIHIDEKLKKEFKIFNVWAGWYEENGFCKHPNFEDSLRTMVTHAMKYIVT